MLERGRWIFLASMLLMVLTGCGGEERRQLAEAQAQIQRFVKENEGLKRDVEQLRDEVKRLSNTPERQLTKITRLVQEEKEAEALVAIEALRSEFPKAPEVARAESEIATLQSGLKAKRDAEDRAHRLGFKALTERATFSIPGLKVAVSNAQHTNQWNFDSHDDTYHYRASTRGKKYVVARVAVTAEEGINDPMLPGFGLYKISGRVLGRIAMMRYEFVRWSDYASYLGNDTDFKNDFAHTATVPFTIGAEVPEGSLSEALFLIALAKGCHSRSTERFNNPPVKYGGACVEMEGGLSISDLMSGKYVVVKIWNSSKPLVNSGGRFLKNGVLTMQSARRRNRTLPQTGHCCRRALLRCCAALC